MRSIISTVAGMTIVAATAAPSLAQSPKAEKVTFPSADGKTQIQGYLFKPGKDVAALPAVIIMHGIRGAYAPDANGEYNASTLSSTHKSWINLLLKNGLIVLIVDDYGSIGQAGGFAGIPLASRPPSSDPFDARPLHAYGALRFLQTRKDVAPDRIGQIGWQLGGSSTLAAMDESRFENVRGTTGFAAGAAIYPSCGRLVRGDYKVYRPTRIFMGSADRVLSPGQCAALVAQGTAAGSDIELRLFEGAGHDYLAPIQSIQSVRANASAVAVTQAEVVSFLSTQLQVGKSQ